MKIAGISTETINKYIVEYEEPVFPVAELNDFLKESIKKLISASKILNHFDSEKFADVLIEINEYIKILNEFESHLGTLSESALTANWKDAKSLINKNKEKLDAISKKYKIDDVVTWSSNKNDDSRGKFTADAILNILLDINATLLFVKNDIKVTGNHMALFDTYYPKIKNKALDLQKHLVKVLNYHR